MKPLAFLSLFALLLIAGCGSSGSSSGSSGSSGGGEDLEGVEDPEQWALETIGDVRIYYWIRATGTSDEIRYVLVNRGHSRYAAIPDTRLLPEEYYLFNADMYDLLVILRDEAGFFEPGASINIGNEDPLERAALDPKIDRIIAVEQVKNGVVNISYFARPQNAYIRAADQERMASFDKAQEWVLRFSRNTIPKGAAGSGKGIDLSKQNSDR